MKSRHPLRIIETEDRDFFGECQAHISNSLDGPQRGYICQGKDCSRTILSEKHRFERSATALDRPAPVDHLLSACRSGLGERRVKALGAIGYVSKLGRRYQDRYVAVPELQQVPGAAIPRFPTIRRDSIETSEAKTPVYQHSRDTLDEWQGAFAYAVPGGRNDQPIHTTGGKALNALGFAYLCFIAADEEGLKIASRGQLVDMVEKLSEERIHEIGNDDSHRARLLRSEAGRYLIGSIVKRLDSSENPPP